MQDGSMEGMTAGAVYVQTNEPDNQVIGFARAVTTASWSRPERHATGGKGDGVASPHIAGLGRADAGWAVRARHERGERRRQRLRRERGRPRVRPDWWRRALAPKSVTEHDGLVYVLNTGDAERDRVPHRRRPARRRSPVRSGRSR